MPRSVMRVIRKDDGRQRPGPVRRRHAGQGIVELALLTPVLLLILLVAVDFGRAYSASIEVTNAAREGAAFGSRSSENANDETAIEDAVLADTPSIYGEAISRDDIDTSTPTDSYGYEQVVVTVEYEFRTLVDYPGIPSSIPISRTVTMRVIGS